MQNITVSEGQSLIDVAVQYLGDATRAFEIGTINGYNLTDELTPGRTLNVPDVAEDKKFIVELFNKKGLFPASVSDVAIDTVSLDGIEYWEIEETFIID